jgi:plasmid stabilization system protein ParE
MNYRVEFARQARSDLFEIYAWVAADSVLQAARWISTLEASICSLDASPERCAIAPENGELEGVELRNLIVGAYRVIFQVHGPIVHVLHIRHSSRRPATPGELGGS